VYRGYFSSFPKEWILTRFKEILETGFVSASKNVKDFEQKLKDFFNVKYALASSSGTSALEMIFRAIDVKNHTVIMPSMTFMATPVAAVHAGAKVIFTDCERENMQIDFEDLKRKIRDDTKAVVVIHMSGMITPHIEKIRKLCDEKGIFLIEDAAHAHGAQYKEKLAGTFGDASAFSFFSTKVLTMGEGGAVITNNEEIYKKSLMLRDHGRPGIAPNVHTELGYNWRSSEFNAVVGIRQMEKAWQIIKRRQQLAKLYDVELSKASIEEISPLTIPEHIKSAYYKYVLFLKPPLKREALKKLLKEKYGVCLSGEVYHRACHDQPVWEKYPESVIRIEGEDFSNTEYVCDTHFCPPLYPSLKEEDVKYVVECLKKAIRELKNE
jgi:dTDP-4-amino-4,6-dideoxygalactose transaminase